MACPICQKDVAQDAPKPFCSKRCADVDLHRWFSGSYMVPGRDGEAGTINPDNPDEDI